MTTTVSRNTWRDVLPPAGWTCAALAAASLHVAVVAMVFLSFTEPDAAEEVAGSLVVELAPATTSTQLEASTTAIGAPAREQSESQPKTAGQQAPVKAETPPVPPALIEPEPELAFPRSEVEQNEIAKPNAQTAAGTAVETSAATPASIAMTPPKIDAMKAEVATAPLVGVSPNAVRAKTTWNKAIASHLERFKRFPAAARAQGVEGSTIVEFKVSRDGAVSDWRIVRSSGQPLLDEAALAMIARAAPVPAAPNDVSGATFTLTVPVVFRVQ
jgi:periplasmic protein TonB